MKSFFCQTDDSILGPLYDDEDQMEVQSPDPGITFRFSNQARFQPASSVQKTPCRLQNEQKRDAYTGPFPYSNGMEVESSPLGWTSPGGLHNQPPFSSVASSAANPGRSEAGYPEYEMPDSPARDDTPSPVLDITRRVQQMDGPSGRVGVATPPPLATENALMATKAPPPRTVSTTRGHVSFPSPQMRALGELEFDRVFLIYVYLAE
jgi:RNA-dependent RNA polymerase